MGKAASERLEQLVEDLGGRLKRMAAKKGDASAGQAEGAGRPPRGKVAMGSGVLRRRVAELRPHPENERVYGDTCDEDLVESVRRRGVLVPLLVTKAGVVVSGHRRLAAARAAGLEEVPVTLFDSDDEWDVLEAVVHSNKQRTKTPAQRAVEAAVLGEVEKERARRRQREAASRAGRASGASRRGEANVPEQLPGRSDGGEAREKVGQALGVSGKTAQKMAEVGRAIREADAGRAQELKDLVNARGVAAAFRELEGRRATPRRGQTYATVVVRSERDGGLVLPGEVNVGGLAAADAVVWLWAATPDLPRALARLRAWGFEYRTTLTLLKLCPTKSHPGEVLRDQAEHCLVAVRGRPTVTTRGQPNVLQENRKWWGEFLRAVERVCPGPKLAVGFDPGRDGWVAHAAPEADPPRRPARTASTSGRTG
jgi:ParB/RepB/Spo0J family partition protein